jgi:hypothetical protein
VVGKTSRRKGANYERRIARKFKRAGFPEAKRHLEYQGEEAEEGRDLDGTQPYAVQVKCWKSTPSIKAIDEITTTEEYPIRVAILKRTQSKGTKPLEVAVVDLNVFLNMLDILQIYAQLGVGDDYGSPYTDDLASELLEERA